MEVDTVRTLNRFCFAALLPCLLVCSCDDPPGADAGPDAGRDDDDTVDAGPDESDAGSDGIDAGVEEVVERRVLMQSQSGVVIQLDLNTKEVSYPFGAASSHGGVAALEGLLFGFSQTYSETGQFDGRMVSLDPDTREITLSTYSGGHVRFLLVDESRFIHASLRGGIVRVGPRSYDAVLEELPLYAVASGVTLANGEIVVSRSDNYVFTDQGHVWDARECGGFVYLPEEAKFLCAGANGEGIFKFAPDDPEEVIELTTGDEFNSLTVWSDGTYTATRRDCSVHTTRELPEGLSAYCPMQFTPLDSRVFFASEAGGIFELTDQGIRMVLAGAFEGAGIAVRGDRIAVLGNRSQTLQIANLDGSDAIVSQRVLGARDIDVDRNGDYWVAGINALHRVSPTAEIEVLATFEDLTDVAVAGDAVYLIDYGSLVTLPVEGGDPANPTDTGMSATLIAGCADHVLVYDRDDQTLIGLYPDGSEVSLAVNLGESTGNLTAMACLGDEQMLVAEETVYLLSAEGELTEVTQLDMNVERATPYPLTGP